MTTIAKKVLAELITKSGSRWTLEKDNSGNFVVVDHSADYRRYWAPGSQGWMYHWRNNERQRVSIESFESFGSDATESEIAANLWREKAAEIYDELYRQYDRAQKN